jgi:hypothetical protein
VECMVNLLMEAPKRRRSPTNLVGEIVGERRRTYPSQAGPSRKRLQRSRSSEALFTTGADQAG